MVSISDRIRALRAEKKLEQIEMARSVGISASSLQKYESGAMIPPFLKQEALAKFFGVSVEYLRGETDDRGDGFYKTYEPKTLGLSDGDGFEIHAHRDPTVSGMDLDQALGLVNQLEKLSKLHDDGKLTDEEYSMLKKKIIRG